MKRVVSEVVITTDEAALLLSYLLTLIEDYPESIYAVSILFQHFLLMVKEFPRELGHVGMATVELF